VLVIRWDSISQLGRYHPRISTKLFRNLSSVIGKRLAKQSVNDKNMRDELTGAVNRYFLCEQLLLEIDRAKRYEEVFSLIIMDIDFLNSDLQQQQNIDEVSIKAITQGISDQTRSVDIFARWDESRFVILMPRTSSELALGITERMKSGIEDIDYPELGRIHISAVVTQSKGEENVEVLLNKIEVQLDKKMLNEKSLYITVA